MIRIKDYIFNENDLTDITRIDNKLRLNLKNHSEYIYINAKIEDIEWNYGGVFEIMSEEEQLRQNRENDKDKILELRNDLIDKLQNQVKELNEELKFEKIICSNQAQRVLKAIEYMEHYIELEDAPINEIIKIEFEELLKILKGEENEVN